MRLRSTPGKNGSKLCPGTNADNFSGKLIRKLMYNFATKKARLLIVNSFTASWWVTGVGVRQICGVLGGR